MMPQNRRFLPLMSAIVLIALIAGVLLVVFGPQRSAHAPTSLAEVAPLPASPLDATYSLEGAEVVFENGKARTKDSSTPTSVTHIFGEPAYGDLTDDGVEDAALLLSHEPGGSGTFFYVVAALKDGEGYLGTNGLLLGDRIAPQTLAIQNGIVVANFAERTADAPMTESPSQGVSAYFMISGATLRPVTVEEGERVVFGSLSTVEDALTFTSCFGDSLPLDTTARAYETLAAVYAERMQEPKASTFVTVVADRDESGSTLAVRMVLAAPRQGTCEGIERNIEADAENDPTPIVETEVDLTATSSSIE